MKTILIADDEPSIRILIHTTLENPECRILEASTGTSAVAMIQRLLPDVVILDWMMPGLNGMEVLRTLREDPRTVDIPVIMVTAMGQEKQRAEGLAAGARAYLVKPFSPLEPLQMVDKVLAEKPAPAEALEKAS